MVYYLLIFGLFLIYFALKPKRSEDIDSLALYELGEMLIMRLVKLFPPKLYCKSRVNFESL